MKKLSIPRTLARSIILLAAVTLAVACGDAITAPKHRDVSIAPSGDLAPVNVIGCSPGYNGTYPGCYPDDPYDPWLYNGDPCYSDWYSYGCPGWQGEGEPEYPPDPFDYRYDSITLEEACPPCELDPLTPALTQAILAEADRLINAWPADDTCNTSGHAMADNINLIRTTPFGWDDPAQGKLVGGDYHRAEPSPGAGRVHVAIGYDSLNPDRGNAEILSTLRHEFAHFVGLPQGPAEGPDPAQLMAERCAGAAPISAPFYF